MESDGDSLLVLIVVRSMLRQIYLPYAKNTQNSVEVVRGSGVFMSTNADDIFSIWGFDNLGGMFCFRYVLYCITVRITVFKVVLQ